MPTLGSLFSGIDGLALGFEWAGFSTLWQVENDPKCIEVLEKHWPEVRRERDIYDTDFTKLARVDCIVGGFPCQPFSHAGRRTGEDDHRYLWPQMLRAIREQRPTFVVAENVYGLVTIDSGLVLETVYLDLEALGYEVAPPVVFPAAAVGAYHRRDRVWICAHARPGTGRPEHAQQQEERPQDHEAIRRGAGEDVAHPERGLVQGRGSEGERVSAASGGEVRVGGGGGHSDLWETEPEVGRVVDGVPPDVDALKQLGNSVVPQAAYQVALALLASWEA